MSHLSGGQLPADVELPEGPSIRLESNEAQWFAGHGQGGLMKLRPEGRMLTRSTLCR
jgi:hypothetical protein